MFSEVLKKCSFFQTWTHLRFTILLQPTEDAAWEFGEVRDGDGTVKRLEQTVHHVSKLQHKTKDP